MYTNYNEKLYDTMVCSNLIYKYSKVIPHVWTNKTMKNMYQTMLTAALSLAGNIIMIEKHHSSS